MRDRTPNWKRWCEIVKEHSDANADFTTAKGITSFRNMQLKLNDLWKSLSREERRWALESSAFFGFLLSDEEYEKEIESHVNNEYYVSPDCMMPSVEEIEGYKENKKMDLETIGKVAIVSYIVYAFIVLAAVGTVGYIAVHFISKFW